jgi:hypothetical protein
MKTILSLEIDRLNFKFLKIYEILKTSIYLKNYGQNRIQKYVVCRPEKIEQVCAAVKSEKLTGFF